MHQLVTELQCIMPIANIASVLAQGVLSYDRVARLPHHSVALQPVQERRDQKQVPGGLKLHQYANLYFHARNPMMFRRKDEAHKLCVLRISVEVLKANGTVITDCNAASDYVRFLAPSQWRLLNFEDIYAMNWTHPGDPVRYYQHRSRKCAEVLVPHVVEPRFITGAYVVDHTATERLGEVGCTLPLTVDPVMFFKT
jgi:ssDNA thymidine ADP-ribosyltransferase, DarT